MLDNGEIIIGIIRFIYIELACFYLTEKYYCYKNKGNCEKCKCWSCKRGKYERKKKDEK